MARSRKKKELPAPAKARRSYVLLALVLLAFAATRLWMLLAVTAAAPDTRLYGALARQGIDGGEVAYRDFDVYYPPVAWWLMAAPRLIDTTVYHDAKALPATIDRYYRWYFAWFHSELFLADVVCLALMLTIGRRISPTAEWALPAAYTLLTIAQPHLLYDRLDLGLLMFFLLCVDCWLRSLAPSPAANRWAVASYLFLGLGISFKVMPVIFVPFLLLADVWASGGMWRLAGRVLSLVVGALGPFVVHMPSAGWSVFSLFQFHAERETHLESIWSSVMLVAAKFGVPCNVSHSHGGYILVGDWSGALKTVSSCALLAMAASLGLWALLRGRRFDRRLALDTALLALINCAVLATVFSPQYLNWLMPLALLLATNIFPRNLPIWCAFAVLVVAIVGISSWLFPYLYTGLIELQPLPVDLCIIRSACLVGLALLLNAAFFAKYGLAPQRAGKPAPDALALAA